MAKHGSRADTIGLELRHHGKKLNYCWRLKIKNTNRGYHIALLLREGTSNLIANHDSSSAVSPIPCFSVLKGVRGAEIKDFYVVLQKRKLTVKLARGLLS